MPSLGNCSPPTNEAPLHGRDARVTMEPAGGSRAFAGFRSPPHPNPLPRSTEGEGTRSHSSHAVPPRNDSSRLGRPLEMLLPTSLARARELHAAGRADPRMDAADRLRSSGQGDDRQHRRVRSARRRPLAPFYRRSIGRLVVLKFGFVPKGVKSPRARAPGPANFLGRSHRKTRCCREALRTAGWRRPAVAAAPFDRLLRRPHVAPLSPRARPAPFRLPARAGSPRDKAYE